MIVHKFFFETEIEAMAFIQGVEFVNDSSRFELLTAYRLEIKEFDPTDKGFEVEVLDLDGGEADAV